jgi:hypothetical protein
MEIPLDLADYRYERKFIISEMPQKAVELIVKHNNHMFCSHFPLRFINNIYFDSLNMNNYLDSVEGASQRTKIRVRWYGDLFGFVKTPFLEFKYKAGLLVTKERYEIASFLFNENSGLDTITTAINNSDIAEAIKNRLKNVEPVLLNRYKRRYYLSANRKYRITIDNTMQSCKVNIPKNQFLKRPFIYNDIILELKYSPTDDETAKNISDTFPFRMTKFSKYVNGIEAEDCKRLLIASCFR